MRLAKLFKHQKLMENASDYQAMIDAFPYDQLRKVMELNISLNPELDHDRRYDVKVERLKKDLQFYLDWAKRVLKRKDRIVWLMNIMRVHHYLENIEQPLEQYNIRAAELHADAGFEPVKLKPPRFMLNAILPDTVYWNDLQDRLEHFMAIDYHKIQNHVWTKEPIHELITNFNEWEREYSEQEIRRLPPDSSHSVILDYPNYVWLNLNKAGCEDEGKAGRHCGNMPRVNTNDRVLSFRKKAKGKQEVVLTFVLEEDGLLGERKGYANNKPKPEYHPYIVELLKQPFIKGFKPGRWFREHDFELTDLSPDLAKDLYRVRPDLFTLTQAVGYIGSSVVPSHVIQAAGTLINSDLFIIEQHFPDILSQVIRAAAAAGNKKLDAFADEIKDLPGGIRKTMALNALTPDYVYLHHLAGLGIKVSHPCVPKIVQNARIIGLSSWDGKDEFNFNKMMKILPRDLMHPFIMKADVYLGGPDRDPENREPVFEEYMKNFTPIEVEELYQRDRITNLSYIQYYGKDHPKVEKLVEDKYRNNRRDVEGYYNERLPHRQHYIDRASIHEDVRQIAMETGIPDAAYDRIFDPETSQKLLELVKKTDPNGTKHITNVRDQIKSSHFAISILETTIEAAWLSSEVWTPLKKEWAQWRSEKLNNIKYGSIVMENDEQDSIDAAKKLNVTTSLPLQVSIDKMTEDGIPTIDTLLVPNESIVDYFILYELGFYVKYAGPVFTYPIDGLIDQVDYEDIREKAISRLEKIVEAMDSRK